jgi:transcription initiation factor IIF auxiliary subunit
VKEAGYAGFILPIEVYFKARDDTKKLMINYDLDLQKYKIQKEEYVFNNPSDDFRRKLIKGGGVPTTATSVASSAPNPVSSASAGGDYGKGSSSSGRSDSKNVSSNNNSTSATNKHNKHSKTDEPKQMNSFKELFGPPITKTSKVSERDFFVNLENFIFKHFSGPDIPGPKIVSISTKQQSNRQYLNFIVKQQVAKVLVGQQVRFTVFVKI